MSFKERGNTFLLSMHTNYTSCQQQRLILLLKLAPQRHSNCFISRSLWCFRFVQSKSLLARDCCALSGSNKGEYFPCTTGSFVRTVMLLARLMVSICACRVVHFAFSPLLEKG